MDSALRAAASAPLPPGAFLRRDRGDGLFVTNAPGLCPDSDWPAIFAAAGFRCALSGRLLRLSPGGEWLLRLEAARPDPPDDLCRSLLRFRGLDPEEESLALFTLGAKVLDGGEDPGRFDKALRRRAAACLRLNRTEPRLPPRGGGLYACALLRFDCRRPALPEPAAQST